MEVGIREFKAKLSEYLAAAGEGEDVVITDRGRPIVRLVPVQGRSSIERGIDEGWIRPPSRPGLSPARPQRSHLTISDVLDEDRG